MPNHVRLKFKDKNKKCSGEKVAEIAYGKFNVPFSRIYPTDDGFKAVCNNDQECDKLLTTEAIKQFSNIGLAVFMPPEIKAKRSLFARQVDHNIGKHTASQIKEEIEDKNHGMSITEIIKIKDYTHVFKIVFAETAMADKTLQHGLHLFNLSITPSQFERERFINVQTCFNCYTYNSHSTANCPQSNQLVCSECAEVGHKYTQCNNSYKGCINCKLAGKPHNHRTLAMSCPIKKEKIKEIEQREKDKQTQKAHAPYAAAVKAVIKETTAPSTAPTQTIQLSEISHLQIMTAVIHAHIMNISNPGTYERELNDMLRLNNLPAVKVPNTPNSSRIFNATATTELIQKLKDGNVEERNKDEGNEMESEHTELEGATGGTTQQEILESTTDSNNDSTSEEEGSTTSEDESTGAKPKQKKKDNKQTNITEGLDAGITIYVNENDHLPTSKLSLDRIINGIENGRYKWTHQEKEQSDATVYDLLKTGKIRIHNKSFKKQTSKEFKKIKNGTKIQSPKNQPATRRSRVKIA